MPEGAERHDGFFLRISSGFSAWGERLSSEDSNVYGGEIDGRSSGIGTANDLSIGGTVSRGLVLALSLAQTGLLASTFRQTDASVAAPPSELDPGLRQLLVVGPTLIWYPNDRGGFMVEAGLSYTRLLVGDASGVNRRDGETYFAQGGALTLAIGQQFFFADQFSVGVRGRFTGAIAVGTDQDDVRWIHGINAAPAVVCDVVYH
jgi:hypothetical protein